MKIKDISILKADETYIMHQCNCITTEAQGLAKDLFKLYPYANTYIKRKTPSIAGTIDIMKDINCDKVIINAYAQYYPGRPKPYESKYQRLCWFKSCLDKIKECDDILEVAIPYNIGCGLAGGDSTSYLKELEELNKYKTIVLYKFGNNV